MPKRTYADLERKIGVTFNDKTLLRLAFIHDTYVNEHEEENECNERLEFLGDSVLGLIVTEYMYKNSSEEESGLHNHRKEFIKNDFLSNISDKLELDNYLMKGNGESVNDKGKNTRIANALEALIGAIFIDQKEDGYNKAKEFVLEHILKQ